MKIARVFSAKTPACPTDADAYFGPPTKATPNYDLCLVSCQFTWDIPKAKILYDAWQAKAEIVALGGVAIHGESKQPFTSGVFLKPGITITSRGCPNHCSFCMVRKELIEFDTFCAGNIVQDNNILACSDLHWGKVMAMLKKQKAIEFKGGLEKGRITPKIAEDLRGLRIKTLWLACDDKNAIRPLERAVRILKKAGFRQRHLLNCYVLIGDSPRENIHRLREVWKMGVTPFAQLYKPGEYTRPWKRLQRRWSRPAIIYSRVKRILNKTEL